MITLTIEAESLSDLRNKIIALATEEPGWSAGVSISAPEPKRPRGRPPRASLVEKEPIEAPPIEAVAEDEPDEVEQAEAPPPDTIANEKVKQEVIAQLSDLFTAGKVKTLRHILDTYGNGAKSFPEIDASQFPAIKEALSRGEAA